MHFDLKKMLGLPYWTSIDFMIYLKNWTRKTIGLHCWTRKNNQIILLELDWFNVLLDLGLKNSWITLLESDWFYYKMALDWLNYWSRDAVGHLWRLPWITNNKFPFPRSDNMGSVKNNLYVNTVAKLGIFRILQEWLRSKSNSVLFKR